MPIHKKRKTNMHALLDELLLFSVEVEKVADANKPRDAACLCTAAMLVKLSCNLLCNAVPSHETIVKRLFQYVNCEQTRMLCDSEHWVQRTLNRVPQSCVQRLEAVLSGMDIQRDVVCGHVERGCDVLSEFYMRYMDKHGCKKHTRGLGQIFTPRWLLNMVVDRYNVHDARDADDTISKKRVIDPAMGSASFLVAHIHEVLRDFFSTGVEQITYERAVSTLDALLQNMVGIEIDELVYSFALMNILFSLVPLLAVIDAKGTGQTRAHQTKVNVIHGDALTLCHINIDMALKKRFDIVFINPPFCSSWYGTEDIDLRRTIQNLEDFKPEWTRQIYPVFFAIGPQLLQRDGVMFFVSPQNWIDSRVLSHEMCDTMSVQTITLFPKGVFGSIQTDCALTECRRASLQQHVHRISVLTLTPGHVSVSCPSHHREINFTDQHETIRSAMDVDTWRILQRRIMVSVETLPSASLFFKFVCGPPHNRLLFLKTFCMEHGMDEDIGHGLLPTPMWYWGAGNLKQLHKAFPGILPRKGIECCHAHENSERALPAFASLHADTCRYLVVNEDARVTLSENLHEMLRTIKAKIPHPCSDGEERARGSSYDDQRRLGPKLMFSKNGSPLGLFEAPLQYTESPLVHPFVNFALDELGSLAFPENIQAICCHDHVQDKLLAIKFLQALLHTSVYQILWTEMYCTERRGPGTKVTSNPKKWETFPFPFKDRDWIQDPRVSRVVAKMEELQKALKGDVNVTADTHEIFSTPVFHLYLELDKLVSVELLGLSEDVYYQVTSFATLLHTSTESDLTQSRNRKEAVMMAATAVGGC